MQWGYSVGKYETMNTKCKNSEAKLRNIQSFWNVLKLYHRERLQRKSKAKIVKQKAEKFRQSETGKKAK